MNTTLESGPVQAAAVRIRGSIQSEYPFESNFLQTRAGLLHYIDEGDKNAPPVLCIHGNPTWSFYYRRIAKEFRSDSRVIAPDHIGCGLSEKPQDWSYELADHIANLEQLVLDLDLKDITLVVHDWGGAIGCGVAVRHPERFKRIFVMNTAAFLFDQIPLRINVCKTPLLGELAVRGLNAFARAAVTMAMEDQARMTPEVRQGYLAPYDSWRSRIATHRFVRDIPMSPKHPSYATLEAIQEGLAKLRDKPMRIAWGMRDWCFTPAFKSIWEERFPAAESLALERAGHYVLEDAHEEVLPWLQGFMQAE
ncbi:MAG: pimeloyl-ACP methyl ester carboxylesterase [Planctomycetota bacterium]